MLQQFPFHHSDKQSCRSQKDAASPLLNRFKNQSGKNFSFTLIATRQNSQKKLRLFSFSIGEETHNGTSEPLKPEYRQARVLGEMH